MRAVLLTDFSGRVPLRVESVRLRALKPGEVLVKMAAAPINPSDLVFLRNQYGIKKPLPVVPGLEGSGIVVDGRGLLARALLGRRVACRAPNDGHGTWAEYMIAPASNCIPLRAFVTQEQGASLIVNPLTAWSFVDLAKRDGHRAFVQTAAASALGRMTARLARVKGVSVINVVRQVRDVERLRSEGEAHVLDSSQADFGAQLRETCRQLDVRLAFDAVGGALTSQLAAALQTGGRVLVYGALAGEACVMNPTDLIFENKRLEGFWLTASFPKQPLLRRLITVYRLQEQLSQALRTDVQARFSLEQANEAIAQYKSQRSAGKVLLVP